MPTSRRRWRCSFTPKTIKEEMVGDDCDSEWLEKQLNGEGVGGVGRGGGGDRDGVLVLDCRSLSAYRRWHIVGALHLAVPTLMMRRLKKGNLPLTSIINCQEGRERFSLRWKKETVVLHDESTQSLTDTSQSSSSSSPTSSSSSSSASPLSSFSSSSSSSSSWSLLRLLLKRLTEDGCTVRLLKGGFMAFSQKFPNLCVGSTKESESTILGLRYLRLPSSSSSLSSSSSPSSPTDPVEDPEDPEDPDRLPDSPNGTSPFPVEVLPNLYLGNAKDSADLDGLCRNGITYILNATPNVPNTFEDDRQFRYLQIPIDDHWSQNMADHFTPAIAFIEDARRKKCGVLVHCLAGISRSVTITVAYLMYSLSLSLNDAYDHVKRCKPNISPNFSFMGQLMDFENSLRLERGSAFASSISPASSLSSASSLNSASSINSASSVNSASSLGSASSCSSSSAYSSASPASGRSDSAHDDNCLQLYSSPEAFRCFPSSVCSSLSSLSSAKTTASASSVSSSAFDYEIPSTHS